MDGCQKGNMLVFLDTEFTSFVRPDLISIALVAQDERINSTAAVCSATLRASGFWWCMVMRFCAIAAYNPKWCFAPPVSPPCAGTHENALHPGQVAGFFFTRLTTIVCSQRPGHPARGLVPIGVQHLTAGSRKPPGARHCLQYR